MEKQIKRKKVKKSFLPTDPKTNLILIVIGLFAWIFGGRAIAFPGQIAALGGIIGLIKSWKKNKED